MMTDLSADSIQVDCDYEELHNGGVVVWIATWVYDQHPRRKDYLRVTFGSWAAAESAVASAVAEMHRGVDTVIRYFDMATRREHLPGLSS